MVRVIEEACESDTSDAAELLSLLREELERIEALLEKALPAHFEKGADGAEA
jgi:Ni,Fe-hydrogenase III large subunit